MEDLEKLEQVFKILDKALIDIEDVGELSDYDLDNEVQYVYEAIDEVCADVHILIQEIEDKLWKKEEEKDMLGNLRTCTKAYKVQSLY